MKSLKDIEKLINSELATKIQNSFIKNSELTIEINENDLIEAIEKKDWNKVKELYEQVKKLAL